MKYSSLLFIILLFLACKGDQQANTSASKSAKENAIDFSIDIGKRVGLITGQSTLEEIQAAYGKDNIEEDSIHIAEGEMGSGLKLFPNSDQELELLWDTQQSPFRPAFVRIRNKKTPWRTLEGVTVGTSFSELYQINKVHFLFYGFEWDYGGRVLNWRGGKLNSNLLVTLQPQNYAVLKPQFMGEVELSSDNPEMRALDLQVRVMVLTFLE